MYTHICMCMRKYTYIHKYVYKYNIHTYIPIYTHIKYVKGIYIYTYACVHTCTRIIFLHACEQTDPLNRVLSLDRVTTDSGDKTTQQKKRNMEQHCRGKGRNKQHASYMNTRMCIYINICIHISVYTYVYVYIHI